MEGEEKAHHPHASLFETIEEYLHSAFLVIADPSIYVK